MTIALRPYDHSRDSAQHRNLFDLSFPETRGTPVATGEHYHWKFETLAATPPSQAFAAEEDGRLVGYYAALPYRYVVRGRNWQCGMVCDVMTHPELRGRGVFTKLGRYATAALAERGVDFVTGYPVRPAVLPGHLKVGWTVAFREPVYVRPVASRALLRKHGLLRVFTPVVDLALTALNASISAFRTGGYTTELVSREALLADPAYDALFAAWAAETPSHLVKDRGFLAWRTGAPGTSYHFVKLARGSNWAGLAIARATELRGIPTLALLDVMVPREHASGLRTLHSSLVDLARSEGCDVIATMASPLHARALRLPSNLYLRSPAVFSVIFKPLSEAARRDGLGDERDWRLMWIDSDDL